MRRQYLTATLAVVAAFTLLGCSGLRDIQIATLGDLDRQRTDMQSEIDEVVGNVNDTLDEQEAIVKDGLIAGDKPEKIIQDMTKPRVGEVEHTQPRQGSLEGILAWLLELLTGDAAIGMAGGGVVASILSRVRRKRKILTNTPKTLQE